MKPLVISFYTPDYAEFAATLRSSCEKFGLEHEILTVDLSHLPTWASRAGTKSQYILDAMDRHPSRNLLWLDADSEIVAPLDLFGTGIEDPAFDYAVTPSPFKADWYNTGTVFVAPPARPLIQAAADYHRMHPQLADEALFATVFPSLRETLRFRPLTSGYNYVACWYDGGPQASDKVAVYIRSNDASWADGPRHQGDDAFGLGMGAGPRDAAALARQKSRREAILAMKRTAERSAAVAVSVTKPTQSLRGLLIATTFHADADGTDYYRRGAMVLKAACERFGLDTDFRSRPYTSWAAMTLQKPAHIAEVLRERKRPVLWMDADSRLVGFPSALAGLTADVAAPAWPGSALGIRASLLWFNFTPEALEFVDAWAKACAEETGGLCDHEILAAMWATLSPMNPGRLVTLPETYAFIRSEALSPAAQPVLLIGQSRLAGHRLCGTGGTVQEARP